MHNNLYFDCFKGIYEKGGNYAEYRQDLADAVILRIYEKAGYQKQWEICFLLKIISLKQAFNVNESISENILYLNNINVIISTYIIDFKDQKYIVWNTI